MLETRVTTHDGRFLGNKQLFLVIPHCLVYRRSLFSEIWALSVNKSPISLYFWNKQDFMIRVEKGSDHNTRLGLTCQLNTNNELSLLKFRLSQFH